MRVGGYGWSAFCQNQDLQDERMFRINLGESVATGLRVPPIVQWMLDLMCQDVGLKILLYSSRLEPKLNRSPVLKPYTRR